ncbi:MAG: hypothetical protein FJY29_12110 [Betaproteobacteria bacterium]|nr:hypothetical protein [Betaproteobacteria bacterium]
MNFVSLAWLMSIGVLSQLHWVSSVQAGSKPAEYLDLFLRASENSQGESLMSEDCLALRSLTEVQSTESVRWRKRAQTFFQARCAEQLTGKMGFEDAPALSDKSADAIWDGTALCSAGDQRLIRCEHRGENGRGLLVYAGRDSWDNSPTLVCAHVEATYRSPFEHEQQVAARCVVTEFDWRYEGLRSDVYGVINWLLQKAPHAPLQIPAALKSQCTEVFPDAIYCTPTLIVFPETDPTRVGICQLNTHDRVLGLGAILKIGSWNSHWVCESKSLIVPDMDSRLSVEERQCVPDHLGQHKTPYCRFPYMPVARKPVRTYIETR